MRRLSFLLAALTVACGTSNPLAPEPEPVQPQTCTIWVVSQYGDTTAFVRNVGTEADEFINLMGQQVTVADLFDDCP